MARIYEGDCKHENAVRCRIAMSLVDGDTGEVLEEGGIYECPTGMLECCKDCGAARFLIKKLNLSNEWYADGFADYEVIDDISQNSP